jgi:hypothetical protein
MRNCSVAGIAGVRFPGSATNFCLFLNFQTACGALGSGYRRLLCTKLTAHLRLSAEGNTARCYSPQSPHTSLQIGTYRNWSRCVGSAGQIHICVVSGFRRKVNDNCALLGQPISPETSVRNYHYSLHNSPEERCFQFTIITFVKIPPVLLNQMVLHLMRGIHH